MPTVSTVTEIALWLAGVGWALLACRLRLGLRALPDLPSHDGAAPQDDSLPRIDVLVPARDEAARIGGALTRMLEQRDVDLRIVAVDDRSTDSTSTILQEAAANDSRVRPVRIDSLPEQWLGKCHACHVGSQSTREDAEWLLLTDADTWLLDDRLLARAVAAAEVHAVDSLCLVPGLANTTLGGKVIVLGMCLGLIQQAAPINARGRNYVGFGAFHLVRRSAYQSVGGHLALRLEVVEDIGLGRLLHGGGFRQRVLFALPDLEVEWITSLRSLFTITEKNYFALFGFRVSLMVVVQTVVMALWLLGASGIAIGTAIGAPWAGLVATAGLMSMAWPAAALAPRYGWRRSTAWLTPWFFPVIVSAALWSMIVTLRQGGVAWRGVHYPLSQLRQGTVRRSD